MEQPVNGLTINRALKDMLTLAHVTQMQQVLRFWDSLKDLVINLQQIKPHFRQFRPAQMIWRISAWIKEGNSIAVSIYPSKGSFQHISNSGLKDIYPSRYWIHPDLSRQTTSISDWKICNTSSDISKSQGTSLARFELLFVYLHCAISS